MNRARPAAAACALLAGIGAALAETAAERARAVLDDPAYQQRLPEAPLHAQLDIPGWLAELALFLAGIARPLLIVGACVLAGILVYVLVSSLRRRRRARGGDAAPPAPLAAAEDALVEVADAERLARAGRYTDAVHLLLLAAIDRAGRRAPRRPPAAATARELVRALPLDEARRGAFGDLVRLVETSLFGGRELGSDDWERGRTLFARLAPGAP